MTDLLNELAVSHCQVITLSLDEVCAIDLTEGRGIRLQSIESFDKKNKNQRIEDGLQSEFFGSDFSSDHAYKERYSCKCKKYIGKKYDGDYCDSCESVVQYVSEDLTKTGWIILDTHYVMSPIYLNKLLEALGKIDDEYVLFKIMNTEYYDSSKGVQYSDKEMLVKKKHPFIKKGTIWLKENFLEVLDFYERKKPKKKHIFDELRADLGKIWVHSIPVYTSLLRTEMPGEKGGKDYKLKINTSYRSIIRSSLQVNSISIDSEHYTEDLKMSLIIKINKYLASIHKELREVFICTYSDCTDKNGIITGRVLGGRYNFSSRNIIIPSSGRLRSDEVEIGYIPFMELFRYELQNQYSKIYGVTPSQANNIWKKACNRFDPEYYAIIEFMIKDEKSRKHLNILISRNPCINYGSFITVSIVNVKKDINNKTLTISSQVIVPMNADFDGDELNVFRIIGEDHYRRISNNLNPRYNLAISRMNGRVNPEVMPIKDECVAFAAFNRI